MKFGMDFVMDYYFSTLHYFPFETPVKKKGN